ncbi:MAG: hypothetical protein LQ340_006237, partial [Diploschistes diacapsis]
APPGIRLAHVRRRLDLRQKLEHDVADADQADDGPDEVARRAPKFGEHSAPDEAKHEARIAGYLRRDLELEAGGHQAKDDDVDAFDYFLADCFE